MSLSQNTNPNLKFPEVKIVEASAGSGKTYELAKRYIQLLVNSAPAEDQIPLRNILAITFTEKAAAELKDRLNKKLTDPKQKQLVENSYISTIIICRNWI